MATVCLSPAAQSIPMVTFTKNAFPYTGMTLAGFMRQHVGRAEVWPFIVSAGIALFGLGGLGFGGSKESRAASKYLNPPKHH